MGLGLSSLDVRGVDVDVNTRVLLLGLVLVLLLLRKPVAAVRGWLAGCREMVVLDVHIWNPLLLLHVYMWTVLALLVLLVVLQVELLELRLL